MRRRRCCAAACAAAVAVAWPVRAQPAAPRRIGFLFTGVAGTARPDAVRVVLDELSRVGLHEGPGVQVQVRHGESLPQLEAAARELLDAGAELIVASFTPAAVAAQRATRDKPIVMAGVADPVASGLVPSLAAPGGNLTGVSAQVTELAVKNLELLREWFRALRQVAVLTHATDPWTPTFLGALQQAAPALGFTLLPGRADGPADYPALFARWAQLGAQALLVQPSLPFADAVSLAQRQRWPSCSPVTAWPRRGGLFAYAADVMSVHRMTASYVRRVLAGESPAQLPVQQVDRFTLVLNLRSARQLGLAVPAAIRLRAQEVIE
jgi:putative tryptophan/tyrosine transport system substrate-binding protein